MSRVIETGPQANMEKTVTNSTNTITKEAVTPLRVCLICIELFGDSIYGGFGRATRYIGRELVHRGHQVSIVVPRRSPDLPDRYELDGMRVWQYTPSRPWEAVKILRHINAQIYHSQDTSLTTFLAQIASPHAKHIITFRDPMDKHDWRIETLWAGMPRIDWKQYQIFIDNPLVNIAVRRSDTLCCAAPFLVDKTQAIHGLQTKPGFLATPVNVPVAVAKANEPTVCFVGRWEGRKRVELFFELARQFPHVQFIAMGGARDQERDASLRKIYSGIENIQMTGVLDQFADQAGWSNVMSTSWILVNTSLREGLPTTFVEATAHRCAILSCTDPDGFATRFGRYSKEGHLAQDLQWLMEADHWRELGKAGYRYVSEIYRTEKAMDDHERLYRDLVSI